MSAFIIGSTGLCGSFFLKNAPNYYNKVYSLSRSSPDGIVANDKTEIILNDNKDNGWVKALDNLSIENPDTFFSALGTTKAKAGGQQQQYALDHDLNLELAKAAKRKGFKKYVLVSSTGANKNSRLFYLKLKGEIEEDIIALGFDTTIILRPGVLLGERKEDKGFLNNVMVNVAGLYKNTPLSKYLGSPIHGEEVANAGLILAQREHKDKVVIVSGNDLRAVAKTQ
jgi:dTDP-4-dehydrorhamnose reductase